MSRKLGHKKESNRRCCHFWITDSKGLAQCRYCGITKQFPDYDMPRLKQGAMRGMGRYEFASDPTYWQSSTFTG